VNNIVGEPLAVQGAGYAERRARVAELLELVGLNPEHGNRYPHEFYGGQRQRLDVSIQAQVLNLLTDIQRQEKLAFLFISHDLRVVRLISHRVAVMYLGKIIEMSPTLDLYERPHHPYTEILIKAAPVLDATNRNREYAIEGEPPSPVDLPPGCRFHPRCPYAREECGRVQPELREIAPGCFVACHYPRNAENNREEGCV